MNYTRYLDLHLCTKKDIAAIKTEKLAAARKTGNYTKVVACHRKFFSHGGTEYFYDFRDDMEQQAKYRSNVKSEGFSYDPEAFFSRNIGNCRNFSDVEITQADISMLRVVKGEISNQLRQMRYIGCMVAIEHLQAPTSYPNLEGLMRWICDPTTTNKMRVNCHGSGTTTGGFHMGARETVLSVEAFVESLQRHGLARSLLPENAVVVGGSMVVGMQRRAGLAQNARWKLDSEVTHCEAPSCQYRFEKSWYGSSNKHHCRRCGGIFCDKHTSKRIDLAIALTEKSGTVKGAKQVRVCDECYAEARDQGGIRDAVGDDLKYGLQTIALGLCMGAKADERFSPESGSAAAGALEAGSLAARLRDELTQRNIRGIKITASNQTVANVEGSGLQNVFGVKYPSTDRTGSSTTAKRLENTGDFTMPATIWGRDPALRRIYDNLPDPKPAGGIVVHGNKVYFGLNQYPPPRSPAIIGPVNQANAQAVYETLKNQFFKKWEFNSWNKTNVLYSTTTRSTPDATYILMSPPPRVTAIVGDNPVQTPARDIRVTGGQVNSYKLTKSYGIS